jgi:hypothetical protein
MISPTSQIIAGPGANRKCRPDHPAPAVERLYADAPRKPIEIVADHAGRRRFERIEKRLRGLCHSNRRQV